MQPVTTVVGRMMPLDRADVDTDQIMPKQFLTRVERTGYGDFVFHDWRKDPDFILNDARFHGANILVAGPNFGSGSSREHAVWGLQQYGFDAVIAPSFSDIFVGNCTQMGLLTVTLPQEHCWMLMSTAQSDPRTPVTIDLRDRTIEVNAARLDFQIDDEAREILLQGLDDVALMLSHTRDLETYESRRPQWLPTSSSGRRGSA